MDEPLTAARAAHRLTHILDALGKVEPQKRFPVDVTALAKGCAELFRWDDPITRVEAASIEGFEGALVPADDRKQWMLLFNDQIKSAGRQRFTQAHELGHYILHRRKRDSFHCSEDDMLDWEPDSQAFESEADLFASYLLMPLNDFRAQVPGAANLAILSKCAERYGVSLTAAANQWLKHTDERAVLIMSSDGFMHWSCSSRSAFDAGAYFATRKRRAPIEIPPEAIAADESVESEREGKEILAQVWFPHADPGVKLREMKLYSNHYGRTISLLLLPRGISCWAPR